MIHLPGARNKAADAISHHPSTEPDSTEEIHLPDDIAVVQSCNQLPPAKKVLASPTDEGLRTAIAALSTFRVITWDTVKQETSSDAGMLSLLHIVESGIPITKNDTPSTLHEYLLHLENLWSVDGVILYKSQIIIPPCLRNSILDALQGVSTMTLEPNLASSGQG